MRRWWLRLLGYALPHWRGLVGVLLLVLANVGLAALRPWPVKLTVDRVLGQEAGAEGNWLDHLLGATTPTLLLAWLAVGLVLIAGGHRLVHLIQTWLQAWLGARLVYALGGEVFGRLLDNSRAWHGRHRVGDLVRRVNADCTCVRDMVMGVALPITQSGLTLVVVFVVMWQLDWMMALVALGVALPMGMAIRLFAGRMADRSYEQAQRSGELMAMAEQTLGVVPVVQAFRREDHEHRRFRQAGERTVRATLRTLAAQLHFRLGVSTASAAGTAAIMLFGGYRALAGQISVGDLYVFLVYLAALYGPLETLAYLSSGYAEAKGKARRVMDVLDAEDVLAEPAEPRSLPAPSDGPARGLVFEEVYFAYEPGQLVLDRIGLTVEPGQRVAMVGATGAGKSTLASLVPRFADPTEGVVRMDGIDLRDLPRALVRSQVAWLPQEPTLLPMSIAENIAFGQPDATREQVIAAAEAAGAHAFITRLPAGYNTVVGERGATLSGGEAQRLAIARALLKDAPIVILDEPTAALDAATEAAVMAALERLTQGRTTLVIAHRLSTIRRADHIVVLDGGRIVESGTHDQLLEHAGPYARLHASHTKTTSSPDASPLAKDEPPMAATRFDGKVFGIGLSKTGTTSLGLALNRLGIPTIDFPHDPVTLRQLEQGDYRLKVLDRYQAATDTPVAPYYAQFDKLYPGSKFILTVRDKESWLRSVEAHWKFSDEWAEHHRDFRRFTYFIKTSVYGAYNFQRDRYGFVYDQHTRNVLEYFKDRPEDLLVLDVCSGEGWEKLCPFLNVPLLDEPFPQANTKQEKAQRREWIHRLAQAQADLEQVVPADATIILADENQFAGSDFAYARATVPFTEVGGAYNGPPAGDAAAVAELDRLRGTGAEYLVFGWPAFWWLEHYREFNHYLRDHCTCRLRSEQLVVFELTKPPAARPDPVRRVAATADAALAGSSATSIAPDDAKELDALIASAQAEADRINMDWAAGAIDPANWTLTREALRFIAALTEQMQPRHVLELGSGVSTRLFCRVGAQLRHPVTISSIDHDPQLGPSAATKAGDEADASVHLQSFVAPVVVRTCCDRPIPMYCLEAEALSEAGPADLVLIDGPPALLGGREGTLYQVMDHAQLGTIVLLDDACREHEKTVLQRWQENLGDAIDVRVLPQFGHGLAVIAVRQPVPQDALREHRLALAVREINAFVPADEPCIFVDGGELGASVTAGREAHAFVERDQQDWGPPADDQAALAELEQWRQRHVRYVLFAWPAFWWLDYYKGMSDLLRREARCVVRNDRLVIFELMPRHANVSA